MALNSLITPIIAALLFSASSTAANPAADLKQRIAAAEEALRGKVAKTNAVAGPARGRAAPAKARLPLRKSRLGGVVPAGTEDCSAQQEPNLAEQCGSWTLGVCDDEYKAWVGCIFTTTFARGGLDCPIDCDAVIGTPSRPSTMPPTEKGATMPPTEQPDGGGKDNDSDGARGLTVGLAAAVAVAAAF